MEVSGPTIRRRCWTSPPTAIRAFLRDRDALWNDDFVGIELDTFDDQRRAYGFYVNPLGVQADLISEEATGNEDTSWDGLWTSAARITERGYDAEIRIPFTTLRFQQGDDAKRWGARFLRIRPRDFRYTYANSRIERGASGILLQLECGHQHLDPGRYRRCRNDRWSGRSRHHHSGPCLSPGRQGWRRPGTRRPYRGGGRHRASRRPRSSRRQR